MMNSIQIADVLDHLALKNDKATMGAKAAQTVDAHPERRFKAAFEAYKEKELPIARKEVSLNSLLITSKSLDSSEMMINSLKPKIPLRLADHHI